MVKYDAVVVEKILSLYRERARTGKFKLEYEWRKRILTRIDPMKFDCTQVKLGLMGYRGWSIPVLLQPLPLEYIEDYGEGLDKISKEILTALSADIYAEALARVYAGELTDDMILFAGLIESGYSQGILPKSLRRRFYGDNKVTEMAKDIYNKRPKK